MYKPPLPLLLSLFLTTIIANNNNNNICPVVLRPDQPRQRSAPRIINGDIVDANLRRALAVIVTGASFCSATLLSRRWILTAAHCKVNRTSSILIAPSSFQLTRDGSLSAQDGTLLRVHSVHKHPRFAITRRGLSFDIAAVRLAADAPAHARFVAINVNRTLPLAGSFARAMGYGVTEDMTRRNMPRQVDIPALPDPSCAVAFGAEVNVTAHVCAGYTRGGCSPCYGDSGGPLLQYTSQRTPVQLAIVSFGGDDGCARPGMPTVFVRTAVHVGWLRQTGARFDEAAMTRAVFGEASAISYADQQTSVVVLLAAMFSGLVLACLIGVVVLKSWKRTLVELGDATCQDFETC